MRFGVVTLLVLHVLLGSAGLTSAQSATLNGLILAEALSGTDCDSSGTVFTTLNLRKWHAYTFFWVGTQMDPEELSLRFCDVDGNALSDQGDNADIQRDGLALTLEVDGFLALRDLNNVTVRLASDGTLEAGDYVMRHWVFGSSSARSVYSFPDGYTQVIACGNETTDRNGVAVTLQRGHAYEFAGNEPVSELAVCERAGQSYVVPDVPPTALRQSDVTLHVFHVRTAAAQDADDAAQAGFTLITHTPGQVDYAGMEQPPVPTPAPTATPTPIPEPVVAENYFATLGSMAQLHYVTLPDGVDAVGIYRLTDEGRGELLLRVDQGQVDAVEAGLVVATDDNRLVVTVSSANILTFAMGPDDNGRVYYLEMDEGLTGPVSASSSRQGGPPGEGWN